MGVGGSKEWHHPSYNLDEEALIVVARYFAALVRKVLS